MAMDPIKIFLGLNESLKQIYFVQLDRTHVDNCCPSFLAVVHPDHPMISLIV